MIKTLLRVLILLFFTQASYSQSVNDYRSVASGNWTTAGIWEVYNGAAWIPATTYPGQLAGTNDVFVQGGFSVTISANITNNFNSLTVGDATAGTDTLVVANTSSFNTSLWIIANGGYASWTSNVTLAFPAGASVVIESGGSLDTSRPCSAAKRIQIGTAIYSTCNGGAGADYSFEELNNGGGTLNVSPSSNSPICVGETLNLLANPSGAGSGSASFSWSGTGPLGYSFSSTAQNPTITGLATGMYTYTVTISDGTISNTESTNVTVNTAPDPPTSGGNQNVCSSATIPALTVTVNPGETADWYDAPTGGTLLLAGNTSYTPTAASSYYAEARSTISTGCDTSITRTEVILTIRSCSVITNRRITYRVNPGNLTTVAPTGTPTTDMIVNFFDDGQFGPGNSYQLQVQNNTGTAFEYEIWIQNVPYASIPGLNLGSHTLKMATNGDGTYSYLFTSTSPLAGFQNRVITGSGGAPSPPGTGTTCGCVSFYKL
ncbi:immunoglobulin domain-containing protein [Aquimarina sp. M1]